MKIAAIELFRLKIPLKSAFAHASHAREDGEAIVVRLTDERGSTGYGEIQPRAYVTGETYEGVEETTGPARAHAWIGQVVPDYRAALDLCREALDRAGRDLALACGFELALLDLAGRRFDVPLAQALLEAGFALREPLPGGVVIGFEVATAALPRHAALLRLGGKKFVKVKVGREDDEARLRAIASVLPDLFLRLDANEAWTTEQAIAAIGRFNAAGVKIASLEQPVPARDLDGLRQIRAETGVAIMADESVCSIDDARALVGVADIFHVRVGKMGGVLGASRIASFARAHGIGLQLGTMVGETGILSRAAEVFGRCTPGLDCLDGKGQNEHLLSEDVLDDPAQARSAPLDAPGLGITISPDKLARWTVGTPVAVK